MALTINSATIELRFSATGLANKDLFSLSDPFLVCHALREGKPAERIGRTETVKDDLNPVWATTISFTCTDTERLSSQLLVDIFDRDSFDDRYLSKHDFLGRAIIPLSALLSSKYGRLDIRLQPATDLNLHPYNLHQIQSGDSTMVSIVTDSNADDDRISDDDNSRSLLSLSKRRTSISSRKNSSHHTDLKRATTSSRASKKVTGTLSVFSEPLNSNSDGADIIFRVSSAMLRDTGALGRRVTQFYEIQRERIEGNRMEWSCVYRSKDGVNVDRNNYVTFDEMSVTELQLHNMQPNRKLRLAFYKRFTRQQHQLIAYIPFNMEDIMTEDFAKKQIPISMEGRFADEEDMGKVFIHRIQRSLPEDSPWDFNSRVERNAVQLSMRADFFLHNNFVSSLNDSPRSVRKLRQLPTFFTIH